MQLSCNDVFGYSLPRDTSERLYHEQADAIVAQGFLSVGYNAIHMDDCWCAARPHGWLAV